MHLLREVQGVVRKALASMVPGDVETYAAMVKPTQDPKHGDYQANCAMSLAKVLGKKPRDIALELVDNHLGDWGTQFGIILHGYKNFLDKDAFAKDPVHELARVYIHVRNLMKTDEDDENAGDPVGDACRRETALLHAGDEENVRLWKMFMPYCMDEIERTYRRLGVTFDHALGESFYNPMLADVVK